MLKMQENEFDLLDFDTKIEHTHKFAKLYILGTHSDYGCIICGLKTLTPELSSSDKNNID